ncbi:universal stress protein UspA [Leifsonia sp. LS1]|uniref:universal stress protein n=1 Tax=Leifsonia sp. LS1 TaxID=2828483 RepID=UPI001CFCB387|nr:universal stress protein [Leifsonia sp. LS1]GIT81779.1 universal stress protein UspA [Leifsonia sp. LS1]
MPGTIMVAVDGDPSHRGAVEWAAARAIRDRARLVLVFVIERSWGDALDEPSPALRAAGEAILADVLGHTTAISDVATRLCYGHVGAELVSESEDADLLVVGTGRGTDRDRPFRGSLAVRVAAAAACTVAVVPHDWTGGGLGVAVGVDGQPPSEVAVAFAAEEAFRLRERLDIVCAGYSANPLLTGLVPEVSVGDHRERIARSAAEFARELRSDLDIATTVVEAAPADGLVNAARGHRLLVVGTHERRGVQRLMLGSVAHDVLLNVRVPVVVARNRRDT